MALCIPLDAVKINNLFPDPNEVCPSLLQHGHVAVLAGFSPIAGAANIRLAQFQTVPAVFAIPRFLLVA